MLSLCEGLETQGFIAEGLLADCLKCGRFFWWWDFFPLFIFGVWETSIAFFSPCHTMQRTRSFKYLPPFPNSPRSRLNLITLVYYVPSDGRDCEYRMWYNDCLPDSISLRQTGSSFNFFNVCWCCFPVCMCVCIKFLYSICFNFPHLPSTMLSKFMSCFREVISTLFLLKVKESSLWWTLPSHLPTILN